MSNTDTTFRILSIDGGGMKGLFSASVIEQLDNLAKLTNKIGLLSKVNMICGTSTGAIIALALSNGIPPNQISSFYLNYGKNIFRLNLIEKLKDIFTLNLYYKYNNTDLKEKLKMIFGNRTIGQSNHYLCIPSYTLSTGMPRVFKKDYTGLVINKKGTLNKYITDNNIPIVDVILASSAAPVYFPVHQIAPNLIYNQPGGNYLDGGLYANNPTLCGYLEAKMNFLDGKRYEKLQILSISSIEQPAAQISNLNWVRKMFGWKKRIIEPFFIGQSYFTDFFLNNINDSSLDYLRVKNIIPLSEDNLKKISLDCTDKNILTEYINWGVQSAISTYNNNSKFFQTFV